MYKNSAPFCLKNAVGLRALRAINFLLFAALLVTGQYVFNVMGVASVADSLSLDCCSLMFLPA